MSIVSSGRVFIYFSWSRSLARTGDEGESCTSTFVAAKTLPRYLSFRENFANGGVPVSCLVAYIINYFFSPLRFRSLYACVISVTFNF